MYEDSYLDASYEDRYDLGADPMGGSDYDEDPREFDDEDCDDEDLDDDRDVDDFDREPSDEPAWMDAGALASAGMGTDEDYGGFGGDDY